MIAIRNAFLSCLLAIGTVTAAHGQAQIPITAGNASGAATSPLNAVDGNTSTLWNSGGPPTQYIDIDMYFDRTIKRVELMPAQLPDGPTTHHLFGRTQAGTWIFVGTANGTTYDSQWITVNIVEPTPFRYLVIQTVTSPSWVAWREVKIFEPKRPTAMGDVVGRDLASGGMGPAGHVAIWDGSQVLQVMDEFTVAQEVSFENFMSKATVWDPISTNIPSFTVKTCWGGQCEYYDPPFGGVNDRVTVNSRLAIINRARQIRFIGATYTLTAFPTNALPRMLDVRTTTYTPAQIGTYRCDTYVLDAFSFTNTPNGQYWMWYTGTNFPVERVVTGDPQSWKNNINGLMNMPVILPATVYNRIQTF